MERRIKSIYYYLKKKGIIIHLNELAEEFGYSTRTILRDLKMLEYNHLVVYKGRGKWLIA
ncbi:MAG TPA: DeoR family transcriptional regulator [Bacillota bacterium]|nr:DeoR family transcriptional regulator [Bacillota bacterium]